MAITKEKKEKIVEKLQGIAKEAKTIVFANFKGLSVAQQSEMRKTLRALDIGYTVAKKSLMQRAIPQMPELEGEVGIAYGKDEIAPAREVGVFVKKFGDTLKFAGGIFGGKFISKDEIMAIAAIPGIDVLRAMFAQVINSPRQRFAVVLGKVAETK